MGAVMHWMMLGSGMMRVMLLSTENVRMVGMTINVFRRRVGESIKGMIVR